MEVCQMRKGWTVNITPKSVIFYSLNEQTKEVIFRTIKKASGYETKLIDDGRIVMAEFYLDHQSEQEKRLMVKELLEIFLNELKGEE